MNLLKFFKKETRNKDCASCKHFRRDKFYDDMKEKLPELDFGPGDNGHNFGKCRHPRAKYSYATVERDTDWLNARLLGTCDRIGRRYEPNHEGLVKILRKK